MVLNLLLSSESSLLRPLNSNHRLLLIGSSAGVGGMVSSLAFQCAYDLAKCGHRPLFVCSKAIKESNTLPTFISIEKSSALFDSPSTSNDSNFSSSILKRIDMYYCEDWTELRILLASLHFFKQQPTAIILDNFSDIILGTGMMKLRPDSADCTSRIVAAIGFIVDTLDILERLSAESLGKERQINKEHGQACVPDDETSDCEGEHVEEACPVRGVRTTLVIGLGSDLGDPNVCLLRRQLLITHDISVSSGASSAPAFNSLVPAQSSTVHLVVKARRECKWSDIARFRLSYSGDCHDQSIILSALTHPAHP